MWTLLTGILKEILGVAKEILAPLLAYIHGKKVSRLEEKEKVLENVKETQKDKNLIDNLNRDSINDIVFTSTKDD